MVKIFSRKRMEKNIHYNAKDMLVKNWREKEIQALNGYLGGGIFGCADENGVYTYEEMDECLKICVKPTGDYNFKLTINSGETTENALEIVGDTIRNTLSFCLYNNDPNWNDIWEQIYGSKEDKNND